MGGTAISASISILNHVKTAKGLAKQNIFRGSKSPTPTRLPCARQRVSDKLRIADVVSYFQARPVATGGIRG